MIEAGRADAELDIRYYAQRLWTGRWLVLAMSLGGLILGLLVAFAQTPRYRARATLQVEPPTPTSLTVTDALVNTGNFYRDRQFRNTQFKILKSRELGERVVERLKLDRRPEFAGSADPATLFQSHVQIVDVPESMLLEINVTHREPAEAALWANTLADIYIDQSLGAPVEAAQRWMSWLQDRLAETEASMEGAQDELLESYESNDLFVPEGSISAATASIIKLSEDYVAAQAERIALEAALNQFVSMRRRGSSLATVPQVASDGVVLELNSQVAALNLELSRLKERYKPAHPEVQKVRVQMDEILKARSARETEIEQALRAEYRQLLGRERELQGALANQKAAAADETRKATVLESLRKKAKSASSLYEVLLQKLNETNLAGTIENDNVRLIQAAWKPLEPVSPNKQRTAGVGLLLGVALGVGFVLARDYWDNTIKDAEEVERYLHLELLAAVPRYDKDSAHVVTEAYQNLRTSLIFSRKSDQGQVVLVAGTAPQEGKTTTLLNVSKLLAVSGEMTVVLDCDLRRANLHKRLELELEPGITDHFVHNRELSALIRPTRVRNLYVLTAGALPPNPPAILARPDVAAFFAYLRRHFRWVMVDSPPIASVTDGLLLARHVDTTVFVVHHDKVDKKLIRRSVASLRKAGGNLAGAVLNSVDFGAQGYYYYYQTQTQTQAQINRQGDDRRGPRRPSRPVAVA